MTHDDNEIPFEPMSSPGARPYKVPDEVASSVWHYMSAFDDLHTEVRYGIFRHRDALRLFDRYYRAMNACEGTHHAVPTAQLEDRDYICARIVAISTRAGSRDEALSLITRISIMDEYWLDISGLGDEAGRYRFGVGESEDEPDHV